MELYKLEKPDLSKVQLARVLKLYSENAQEYGEGVHKMSEPNYYYWDTIKYKTPPAGLNNEEYWALIKQVRKLASRSTNLKAEDGTHFTWLRPYAADEHLHKIDVKLGGEIFAHYSHIITPYGKRRLLTKSIIEEAIASSQLEGAATTTPIAKKMLLENRAPKDKSEHMIVNNYRMMQALNEKYKDQPMSHELLFELHGIITKNTLAEDKQGRYRTDEDGITVNDGIDYIYHIPPKARFLNDEMDRLIQYANDEDGKGFVHPIIKAIFLHFWIGYLHPFYDGNGRIARTIFYWYLLRKGYWAIQYLPISLVIKNAHQQYGMAYIYAEQDGYDLTYFFDFHIKKILLALKNFDEYVSRKITENSSIEHVLNAKLDLNDRQAELLKYLLIKGELHYVTPSSYVELYKVSKVTALKDLQNLEKQGLLHKTRIGKNTRYAGTAHLMSMSQIKMAHTT
jgi:Fic family protein